MLARWMLPVVLVLTLCSFLLTPSGTRVSPVSRGELPAFINSTTEAGTPPVSSCELRYDSTIGRAYYIYVDEPASYRGGTDTMMKVLQKNIRYPQQTGRCGDHPTGTVWLSFIIEPDGTISNKKLVKPSTSPYLNTESLRVIDCLKDWIPGKCQGEAVPVLYYFPVRFVLQ